MFFFFIMLAVLSLLHNLGDIPLKNSYFSNGKSKTRNRIFYGMT